MVERAFILPPKSSMEAAAPFEIREIVDSSPLRDRYAQAVDRVSAYETLAGLQEREEKERAELAEREEKEKEKAAKEKAKAKSASKKSSKGVFGKAANSAANTIGRELGRSLVRGVFGILKR